MIIYDLRCSNGHPFEGWFKDREAFEKQKADHLISCPVCKSTDAERVPSSVAIMSKDSRPAAPKKAEAGSVPKALKEFREYIQKNFDDVGDKFAEVALRIHQGEEEGRNIRGTTTPNEEETLRDEGVAFIKLPLPDYDA